MGPPLAAVSTHPIVPEKPQGAQSYFDPAVGDDLIRFASTISPTSAFAATPSLRSTPPSPSP